ncbi:hypothetical protein AA309_08320 [Microvirga vignae]|uniref:Transposase n=1 Tax=Microvirga vignae TaxID=1225564 RepID=A0A0H1RL64_9HYPH|nr:hypothetical protein AA309_08320 [Microvirga vignae]
MTKTRREITPEFKREAVALLESRRRPLMQIASASCLNKWPRFFAGADLRFAPGDALFKRRSIG